LRRRQALRQQATENGDQGNRKEPENGRLVTILISRGKRIEELTREELELALLR
jgi:hypothetical protein